MKFKVIIIALLAAIPHLAMPAAGRDNNTCTNLCAGNNVSCQGQEANCGSEGGMGVGLNAAGDKVNIALSSDLQEENWGKISRTKAISFNVPAVNSQKLISVTASSGNFANKKINLLITTYDLRAANEEITDKTILKNIRNAAKNPRFNYMLSIYRKVEGEKQWTDIGPEGQAFLFQKNPTGLLVKGAISSALVLTLDPFIQTDKNGRKGEVQVTIDLGVML